MHIPGKFTIFISHKTRIKIVFSVLKINERCTQLNKILLNMLSILPPIISPDPSSVQWEGLCFL
jgi:hypothetical protein